MAELRDLLQRIPFFGDLSGEQLGWLAEKGSRRSMAAGETVFRAGDPGDSLYVLLSGAVRVLEITGEGQEVELIRLGAGDYFGEMAIIDGSPRSARIETLEPCEFFLIGRGPFLELLAHSPRMLTETLAGFTRRMRHVNEVVLKLALEEERQRAEAEIERHRSISQMVAGVAHEINTPLGIINQAASVIGDSLKPDDIRRLARGDAADEEALDDIAEAARLILGNASRARELVTSFKNLSVRQVTDKRETVDFGKLVAEVAGLYRFQARASKLQVVLQDELGDDPAGRTWDGYPGYVSQIILNLLSNADRYAYPDGHGGRVEILVRPAQSSAPEPGYELVVTDFGRGIAAADLPHVFDAFFTTGHATGGTGLGLAIVYNLVTSALEGSLEVNSTPGEGARFILRLPRVVKGTACARQPAVGLQGGPK